MRRLLIFCCCFFFCFDLVLGIGLVNESLSFGSSNPVFLSGESEVFGFSSINLNFSSPQNLFLGGKNREFLSVINEGFLSSNTPRLKNFEGFDSLVFENNTLSINGFGASFFVNSSYKKSIPRKEILNVFERFVEENDLGEVFFVGNKEVDNLVFDRFSSGVRDGLVFYNNKVLSFPFSALIIHTKIGLEDFVVVYGAGLEGEVAALRFLARNKDYVLRVPRVYLVDDLDALLTYDFFHVLSNEAFFNTDSDEFRNVVWRALNGRVKRVNHSVNTSEGVNLRFVEYESLLSSKVKDFFNISNPVVFAGGLWSDVDAFSDLAFDMSDFGWNSYCVEITGGPGQDCEECLNYDYNNLIDSFWPSLIGGVSLVSNNTDLFYVGHSNGARVAISSLEKHNEKGLNNTATMIFNNEIINISMSKKPIKKLIAIGVPGSFEGIDLTLTLIKEEGNKINEKVSSNNLSHIDIKTLRNFGLTSIQKSHETNNTKISTNLWNNYFYWINSTKDTQIGRNLSLENFLIIKGTACITSDCIVTIKDEEEIYSNIISNNKRIKSVFTSHSKMIESKKIQKLIKEFLNN